LQDRIETTTELETLGAVDGGDFASATSACTKCGWRSRTALLDEPPPFFTAVDPRPLAEVMSKPIAARVLPERGRQGAPLSVGG
jgi:hypothetical protein